MLILAIDTATPAASVALLEDEVLLNESFFNIRKNHSLTIMPFIDQSLKYCGVTIRDVSAVAVSIGPGSFTGLRIGLATAKGLCAAAGLPLIAVPTLEMLAHNITGSSCLVGTLLDARKNEVYLGIYSVEGRVPKALISAGAGTPEQFAATAFHIQETHKRSIILIGSGVKPYQNIWSKAWGSKYLIAPPHLLFPRASALADLAAIKYAAGEFEDVNSLRPYYIRLSEAEIRLGQGEISC